MSLGNSDDPGMIPRTLVLVFNTLKNKLMSECKYKPDKVVAAHILDDISMEREYNIRNNIFNNWSNEKNQVFRLIYKKLKCILIFQLLRMI